MALTDRLPWPTASGDLPRDSDDPAHSLSVSANGSGYLGHRPDAQNILTRDDDFDLDEDFKPLDLFDESGDLDEDDDF